MTHALASIPFSKPFSFSSNWTKEHPKIALITAIACAALGIAATAAVTTMTLIPTSVFTLVASALAAFSLSIGLFVSYAKHSSSQMHLTPQYLTQVMQQTLQDLKKGYYTSPNGQTHTLSMQPAVNGTVFFTSAGHAGRRPGNYQTVFSVISKDCLEVARELHARGSNPLILDNANADDVGGGYLRGAKAQEEDCCRRSGLSVAIDTRHGMQPYNHYPLNQSHVGAGLYVPQVPVFRAGENQHYQYLNEPFSVAFAVMAAICRPQLQTVSGQLRLNDRDAHITRERVRTIVEMAYRNGHRSLVLGAFGCGAFWNPPNHIAEIFSEVIHNEYPGCFEEIAFAILDDHNAGKTHNPEGNYRPFVRALLEPV